MNRSKHSIMVGYCILVAIVCILTTGAQTQQGGEPNVQQTEIGRNDPFGQLAVFDDQAVAQNILVPEITESNKPELFMEVVTLKFLEAESLKQAIDNMSSEHGSISANMNNNSLIICDTKEYLYKILNEIKKADITPQQIMIEVVILDVQLNNDTEIGVNWDLLSDERYNIGYRQNFTSSRIGSTIENATTIGDASAFNTTGLGGSFSVISSSVRHVVELIQQKRNVEILASPRVMVVSGKSASIEAVEELPYTEISDTSAGGAGAITTTRFKNVGIQLNVVATLTDSNDIFLTILTEQNVATGQSDTEVPIVDTRRANTSLLLKDGQVVVFGGLRRQEETEEIDQIPILGDLPIIGFMFRNTNKIINNSELIVFLSPHIYKGEPIPEDEMEKYRQITDRPLLSIPQNRSEL